MARTEIANLHSERDNYEEAMKKAFMRGVCALNMEAMNMFKANDEAVEPKEPLNRDKQGLMSFLICSTISAKPVCLVSQSTGLKIIKDLQTCICLFYIDLYENA